MGNLTPEQRKKLDAFNRLPMPSNPIIHDLFSNVNRVVIKEGGVYEDKPMGDKIGLVIEEQAAIEKLESLLRITDPPEQLLCMCLGNHSFELYSGTTRKAVFALHHNKSLRIWGCKSDADLANPTELISWLSDQGYQLPLLETE